MDLNELLRKALGVSAETAGSINITDICEDSRRVTPGALFVAVPGTKADGNSFIADAIKRGAAAVVVGVARISDRLETGLTEHRLETGATEHRLETGATEHRLETGATDSSNGVPVIPVSDPRLAVARCAATLLGLDEIQKAGRLSCVGVTGTNGKSTFAFMVRHLFRAAGRTTALFGTIEYDLVSRRIESSLTTPDAVTLTRHLVEAQKAGATHAVMEVSSHSLDQRRTDGVTFSIGVFTNLTQDHLDYHGTLENYLIAKKRLFDNLAPDAAAVVNGHDPASDRIVADCRGRVLRYGLRDDCNVRGTILREDRTGGRFLLEFEGKRAEIQTPLVGRHNIFNALSAAATALAAGIDLPTIQKGLAELQHVPGRLQRVPTGDLGLDIFVDYAHTDDALRNVLSALRPLTTGRLWCVFGCGGDRDRFKRPKMARAVAEGCDDFVITSDNPRTEDPLAILSDIERGLNQTEMIRGITIPDRAKAIAHAIGNLSPGDCLVIAGKGHENYQILGEKKIHFDDAEVAAEAVAVRRAEGVCAR